MDVRMDCKESWAPKYWCFWTVVIEKILESPMDCKEFQAVYSKWISPEYSLEWCWSWNSNNFATWCKELTHWKRPWCWERLKTGGEGYNRGCDCWMALLTQQTWVWGTSWSWRWTGMPGMLHVMGSWRVRHGWATELNWQNLDINFAKVR